MGGNAIETDHVEVTSAYAARAPSNAPSACGKYSLYFILGFSAENDHFKVRDVGQLALSPNVLSRPDLLQPYLHLARNRAWHVPSNPGVNVRASILTPQGVLHVSKKWLSPLLPVSPRRYLFR
jgi:hypothetical protein